MTYFVKIKGVVSFQNAIFFGVEEKTFKANVAASENCKPQDIAILEKSDINMDTCKLKEFMQLNQQLNRLSFKHSK